jgi:hypothetical protein
MIFVLVIASPAGSIQPFIPLSLTDARLEMGREDASVLLSGRYQCEGLVTVAVHYMTRKVSPASHHRTGLTLKAVR